MKAIWNDQIIAESNKTIRIENNHYFPADSIKTEYFVDSDTHTFCPWKGEASYKSIAVNGETNIDASWYYPDPKNAAREIAGYFAFWRGVKIEDLGIYSCTGKCAAWICNFPLRSINRIFVHEIVFNTISYDSYCWKYEVFFA